MKLESPKMKKVVIAMSGGVDSSVAAVLLKRAGFDLAGVFMKFWLAPHHFEMANYLSSKVKTGQRVSFAYDKASQSGGGWNRCCSLEAEVRARKVAKILKIPFYVLNFKKDFKKKIVDYFLKVSKEGRTPNPCVVCNKEIKFGLLLEKALALGADYIATGHYARKSEPTNNKLQLTTYKLLRAKDKEKDQSYFLWQLSQEQLKHILFPIGDYTRKEVENLARKFKLPVLRAKKSVEICFIQTTINDFLRKYLKEKHGKIIDREGKVVGKHRGLWFYTIGQRKGIGLSGGKPYYVLDKDLKKNALIVTENEKNLDKKELICENINWIRAPSGRSVLDRAQKICALVLGEAPKLPLKIKAKIRYRSSLASATIYSLIPNSKFLIRFAKPQRAITPGQSVVFFKGQELLGGGIIC